MTSVIKCDRCDLEIPPNEVKYKFYRQDEYDLENNWKELNWHICDHCRKMCFTPILNKEPQTNDYIYK